MEENELISQMLDKSKEAFLLAIEIYNKPTIKYRLEGFAFSICNAWELLLKAYLIKLQGNNAIYFEDKPSRTISLTDCIKKVFTNENDPTRKNLEIIIDLRNTSTHFIIRELEEIYYPFLQACTLNYSQKLYDYFSVDITQNMDISFLSLVTNSSSLNDTEILSKYGNEIFNKFSKIRNETASLLKNESNDKLAINVNLNLRVVKNAKDANLTFSVTKNADEAVYFMNTIKDINTTYPYSQKKVIEIVKNKLARNGISNCVFHQKNLDLIYYKYNLKNNEDYYYHHDISNRYNCSIKLIDFLYDLLSKDPNICLKIKEELKENKN